MSEFRFPPLVLPKPCALEAFASGPRRPTYLLPNTPDQQMLGTNTLFPLGSLPVKFTHKSYLDGDEGKMVFAPGLNSKEQVRGFVLLAPGQLKDGFENTYKYALDHIMAILALYGFVCICVRPRPKINTNDVAQGTPDTLLRYVDHCASDNFFFGFLKGKPLAFVGHSQAGLASVNAGNSLRTNAKAGTPIGGYAEADAIVSLAGTYNGLVLNQHPAKAYLGLRGNRDRDLPMQNPLTLRQYCEVGGTPERYFLWVRGCNHTQWTRRPRILLVTTSTIRIRVKLWAKSNSSAATRRTSLRRSTLRCSSFGSSAGSPSIRPSSSAKSD